MSKKYDKYINKDHSFDKKMMLGIFSLIIVIGGVFGWVYEVIFYYLNSGMTQVYWRGGNFLPWINIYATGSIIIYILTYKHRKNPLKVFSISLVSCGVLEYFSGLGIYLLKNGTRYWDYNTEIWNFGNIDGFVCLRSVLFFAFAGLILIYIIVPFCFNLAKKMDRKSFLIMSITLGAIFLFDEFYNLIFAKLFSLPRSSYFYKKLGFHYLKF